MAMAQYGSPRVVIACECGQRLMLKEVNEDNYERMTYATVVKHECVACENRLLNRIKQLNTEIAKYETKLANFKEFANMLKGK